MKIIIDELLTTNLYVNILASLKNVLLGFSIAFVVSILVILSNITLIRKEGFNLRNILGIVFGILLCFATRLPDIMYVMLNT